MKLPCTLPTALRCAAAIAAAALALCYILPLVSPAVAAFALAAACEPAVKRMSKRLGRRFAAFICSALLIAALLLFGAAVTGRVLREFRAMGQHFPEAVAMLTDALAALETRLYLTPGAALLLQYAADAAPELLTKTFGAFSAGLLSLLTSLAGHAPASLFFLLACAIDLYLISSEYPRLLELIKAQVPPARRAEVSRLVAPLKELLSTFVHTQFVLMCLTFGELLIAFTFLRVEYAISLALALALLDALPVLGAGMALVPWALAAALTGQPQLAVGLLASYAVIFLVRNAIQIRGIQLHPLAALTAMYAGFRLWGLGGMLIAPIIIAAVKEYHDRGMIRM